MQVEENQVPTAVDEKNYDKEEHKRQLRFHSVYQLQVMNNYLSENKQMDE